MYGDRPGERLGEAERARLHLWLRRRGRITVELEAMTPLVEARYFVRYRMDRVLRMATYGALAALVAWFVWEPVSGVAIRGTPAGLWAVVGFLALLFAVVLAALWYQRRADRRIGEALCQRAARSSAVDLRAVLGGRFVEATVVVYSAGLLIGGAAAGLATGQDRVLSLIFVVGWLICAGVAGALLADVARRPAIAEDDRSLAADDTMRRDDANQGVLLPVAGLAATAAAAGMSGWLVAVYLGYGAAVMWVAVVWWRASVRTRRTAREVLWSVP